MPTPPPEPEPAADSHRAVLKDEPTALVERIWGDDDGIVCKTYRNRGLRLLQTFLRRPRAAREHDNLLAVARAGVPCTPPCEWSAQRHFGLVPWSRLVTRFVADTTTLKAMLHRLPPAAPRLRRQLANALGLLLVQMHAGGILWCTPMPRNVLVAGAPSTPTLVVCDVPAVVRFPRAVPPGPALLDLYDAIASPSRRRDWSATERWRCLLAYCAGDRAGARHLWRRLARRSRLGQRIRKNLLMAWRTYILPTPVRDLRGTAVR